MKTKNKNPMTDSDKSGICLTLATIMTFVIASLIIMEYHINFNLGGRMKVLIIAALLTLPMWWIILMQYFDNDMAYFRDTPIKSTLELTILPISVVAILVGFYSIFISGWHAIIIFILLSAFIFFRGEFSNQDDADKRTNVKMTLLQLIFTLIGIVYFPPFAKFAAWVKVSIQSFIN